MKLLDLFFPKFCVGCGREGLYICKDCEIFLSEAPNTAPGLFTVWQYEGLIEKMILDIKYKGYYHLINELADRAFQKIELTLPFNTYITYVPMWPRKERRRGFNQSALLAQKLGNVLALSKHKPVRVVGLLEKAQDNRSQVGLSPKERIENVKGAFEFQGSFVPQNVLLVDDVYTTGATMQECIKTLKKAGVKNIWGFALSRKMNIQNC